LSTSNQTFKLYPATRVWNDDRTNWTLAESGGAWQVPGAMGAADRGAFFHEFTPSQSGTLSMVLNASGRALVESWVNQPSRANKGIIVGHERHGDGFSFASTEFPTVSDRPTLVYECE
jgi:hypothetical protein